jgi:predicted Zn-dependent protease
VVTGTGGVVYVYNLEEVPITRRRRFNIISPEAEQQMMGGTEAYEMILKEFRGKILPAEHPHTRLVTKVVERLLPATGGLAGGEWRVHVVDDPNQKNAFVMPGGKVFVFTGILPICQDEAGLAAVLGHEIAHNVAHHAAERLSRSSITMIIALGFSLLFDVGGQLSNSITDLFLTLPNSRTQEAEADHIGLMIMAESCYNPSSALDFWARMKTAEQVEVPQFISTHPSHGDRAKHIKEWLPEAQRKYDDKGCGPLAGYAEDFKQSFGMRRPSSRPVQLQERLPSRRRDDDDDFF